MLVNVHHFDKEKEDTKPLRMVSFAPDPLPVESILGFEIIESVGDILRSRQADVCLVFAPEAFPVLKCWVENKDVFPESPVYLTGVPGAEQNLEFEKYVYDLPRMAYHTVVGDLSEAVRRADNMTDTERASSIYAREQDQITRASGFKKDFNAFSAPDIDSLPAKAKDVAEEDSNGGKTD